MRFWNISYPDLNNGLGCRVTLWIAGCNHHCLGCQNKQTWDFEGGRLFTKTDKDNLFGVLEKPYIKGITLSGGDPMDSFYEVLDLTKEIKNKFPTKDIWLYTGYTLQELKNSFRNEIIPYVHYVVDGKFDINTRDISLKFRGSSNQIIWEKDKDGNLVRSKLND